MDDNMPIDATLQIIGTNIKMVRLTNRQAVACGLWKSYMKNFMVALLSKVGSANLEVAKTVAVAVPSAPVERHANVQVNVPIHLIVTNNDNWID
jgi:hypothetical protein